MNKVLLIFMGILLHSYLQAQDLGGDTVIKPRLHIKYLTADSQERKAVLMRPAAEPTFTLSGQSLQPISVQLNSQLNKDFASLSIGYPTYIVGRLLYTHPKIQVSLQSDLYRNRSIQDFTRQEVAVRTSREYMNYRINLDAGISYDEYATRRIDPVRWTTARVHTGLTPKDKLWDLNLDFLNTENQGNQEVWFQPSFSYSKRWHNWHVKMDTRIDNSTILFKNQSYANNSLALGSKMYLQDEKVYKQIGLGVAVTNSGTYLLPDFIYRKKMNENLVLQLQSVTTQKQNALAQVLRTNPYIQKIPKFTPTILYDHQVKIETNLMTNYSLHAGLGMQSHQNMIQYLWTDREDMEMRIATRRNAFVSEIGVRYTSSTIDYMEIKFQNNQWLSKNTNWSLPTWIAKAEYSKSLNDRIILRADLMAISKRKGGFQDNGQITILKDALVGNAQANYQLNKRWRLSLQVENFMNSKAEIWDGYPVLPLRVLLGGQCALD